MLKYCAKRIALMPIILVLTTFLLFLFINLSPVDPVYQILGSEFTQEQAETLREELGLNKPLLIQYLNWLWDALHGDLGTSYMTRQPVVDEVLFRIPVTVKLSLLTTLVVLIVGMPLGVLCAVNQYRAFDSVVNVISKILSAFPQFLLAILLMLIFSTELDWLPSFGITNWKSWILPVATLAIPSIANYIRQARSSMLDCIRQDYIRTARSKGMKERNVIVKEALKNALMPLITITGTQFALLIGNAVVVEKIFSISGIGSKVIEAINSKDVPVVLTCTVIIAAIFIVMTMLIDVAYAVVDPRIKATFSKGSHKKEKKVKTGAEQDGGEA